MNAGAEIKQIIFSLAYFLTACMIADGWYTNKEILFYLSSYGIIKKFSDCKNPTAPF